MSNTKMLIKLSKAICTGKLYLLSNLDKFATSKVPKFNIILQVYSSSILAYITILTLTLNNILHMINNIINVL